jgi:LmbE family N-acetylglucosaminyl deacetylase
MNGRLLDEVRPDTILTFGSDEVTCHPDDITLYRWVTEAWQQRPRRGRLLYATATVGHLSRFGGHYEPCGVYMIDQRPSGFTSDELAFISCSTDHSSTASSPPTRPESVLGILREQPRW